MASERIWNIERLVPGGDGFARLPDGRAGFANGAVVGDRIEVLEAEERRGYVRARSWRLLEPSPDRVEPPCPIFDRCGGCDWMHLSRPAQMRHKLALLEEALRRTGHFFHLAPIQMRAAGADTAYRSRLRLHIDQNGQLGLYARGSHQVIAVAECAICTPEVNRALAQLQTFANRHARVLAIFDQIEVKSAPQGVCLALRLFPRHGKPSEQDFDILFAELAPHFVLDIVGTEVTAREPQRWPLPGDLQLLAPVGSFTQVNWSVNLELIRSVVEGSLVRGVRRFCDLFCGAGNFSLPLAGRGLHGMGIDQSEPAISAARQAARENGLASVEFVAEDVARTLGRLLQAAASFDLVIIDPPRAGAKEVIPSIVRLGAAHLAVCSCDPVTLARDLRLLVDQGFILEEVQAFDMFPHTHHLEALAWLRLAPE